MWQQQAERVAPALVYKFIKVNEPGRRGEGTHKKNQARMEEKTTAQQAKCKRKMSKTKRKKEKVAKEQIQFLGNVCGFRGFRGWSEILLQFRGQKADLATVIMCN